MKLLSVFIMLLNTVNILKIKKEDKMDTLKIDLTMNHMANYIAGLKQYIREEQ